jgi:arginyl-tRNA synthetase
MSAGLRELDAPDSGRKRIVVEFSSPNIGKEFDGAHLRSTIIGAYIASLYESMGWDVCRMNFLGDWGRHIGLLAVGWSRFSSEELFDADPLGHLLDVYTKIDELFKSEQEAKKLCAEDNPVDETQGISAEKDAFFKRMEDGDPDALALWKRFREVCIPNYANLYTRMNIKFDDYSGESEISQETVAEIEAILREKGVYEDSEEAWIIDFKKHESKGLGIGIARYRDGTTSYLLRDIAAVLERSRKHPFDKMIYVVSARQDAHFQQLFRTLELMDYSDLANRLQHVSFARAQGLSPKPGRSGLLLGDTLDQCQTAVHEFLEADQDNIKEFQGGDSSKVSDVLGGIALMTQDLSIKRGSKATFDINKVAIASGYTGLSLQDWFAKLSSKLNGVAINREELESTDYSIFEGEAYADVLRLLIQFPGIVKSSFRSLESSTILTYLFRLIDLLPAVWDKEAEPEDSHQNLAQLAFYESVRQVLENGMRMVGLVPMKSTRPELPKTHRALVLSEIGKDPTVQTVPFPQCTPGSAIVRISVAGVLPYSRDIYNGKRQYPLLTPLTIGSNAIGRVVQVATDTTSLAIGKLVFVDSYIRGRDNKGISFLSGVHGGMCCHQLMSPYDLTPL